MVQTVPKAEQMFDLNDSLSLLYWCPKMGLKINSVLIETACFKIIINLSSYSHVTNHSMIPKTSVSCCSQ